MMYKKPNIKHSYSPTCFSEGTISSVDFNSEKIEVRFEGTKPHMDMQGKMNMNLDIFEGIDKSLFFRGNVFYLILDEKFFLLPVFKNQIWTKAEVKLAKNLSKKYDEFFKS